MHFLHDHEDIVVKDVVFEGDKKICDCLGFILKQVDVIVW